MKKYFIVILLFLNLTGGAQNKTAFSDDTGEYALLLKQLENRMMNYQEKWIDTL
jgi:hypothetical protein